MCILSSAIKRVPHSHVSKTPGTTSKLFSVSRCKMRGMGQHYTSKSEYPTEDGHWWSSEKRGKYACFPQVRLAFYKRWFGQLFYGLDKWLGGIKRDKNYKTTRALKDTYKAYAKLKKSKQDTFYNEHTAEIILF